MDIEFNAYFEALEAIARHMRIIKARPHPASGERLVMIVNEEWLFVFPHAAAREMAILDLIRAPLAACGVLTPVIEMRHPSNADAHALTYFAYRMIPGRPLANEDLDRSTATHIAEELGRTLAIVHQLHIANDGNTDAVTLVHGGLDLKCILVDDTGSRLTGLVGWRQATAGAPDVDLAALRELLGHDLHMHALAAYRGEGDGPCVA